MKRIFDFMLSLVILFILVPVIILVAFSIRMNLGRPIFFRQVRPGKNGQPFEMIKFRTMKNATDLSGNLLPDKERMTWLGNKLRNSSLDELPELWNVLKGDMSIVGPRPLLMQYLPLYNEQQSRRHEVRPGITGWAQINGRNAISWEEKFKLDVWYVDNHSLLLDIKILFLTVKKVLLKEGITSQGQATSEPFKGNHCD